jgi:hypothetical protein
MKAGRFIIRLTTALLAVMLFGSSFAFAASNTSNSSGNNSKTTSTTDVKNATGGGSVQGYAADKVLQDGTVVQLADGSSTKVVPASSKDLSKMYGAVVDPHQLSLTITDNSLANEAYVATSGTYNVLVSTQAGVIKQGDYVTMSAVDGVAMKAGNYQDQKTVFGRAAGSFDGKSNSIGSVTLKDTDGQTDQTAAIGLIPVAINIQRNPNDKSTKANLPPALQRIGQAIADKPVGPLRIYLSIGITGLSIIVALTTLYAGIRNALVAIGRNPLSKKSIFRGLLEIILTGFLILIIGLFAVYLLLKL